MRALLITIPLLLVPTDGNTHSWYDPACCSEEDCDEMPENMTPEPTNAGWLLYDGTVWPYDKARRSQDGKFHECIPPSSGKRICLYAPDLGS